MGDSHLEWINALRNYLVEQIGRQTDIFYYRDSKLDEGATGHANYMKELGIQDIHAPESFLNGAKEVVGGEWAESNFHELMNNIAGKFMDKGGHENSLRFGNRIGVGVATSGNRVYICVRVSR
jgi:hypothetical protein